MAQHYRLALSFLLALPLALAGANAAAQSTASGSVSATLKNSQLMVIDLTPRDGKAPSYSFPAFSQSATVSANLDMANTAFDVHRDLSNGKGSDVYTWFYKEGANASASTGSWGSASTQAYANGLGLGNARVDASARQLIGISVGARSRLVYSGLAEISINESNQSASNRTVNSGSVSVGFNGVFQKVDFQSGEFTGGYAVLREEFSLFYDNNTDAAKTIWMSVATATNLDYITTAPIPEPATYAMLGLGALVVGAAARRRRKASAA